MPTKRFQKWPLILPSNNDQFHGNIIPEESNMQEPNLDIKGIEAAADHFNDQIEIHMELAIFHT